MDQEKQKILVGENVRMLRLRAGMTQAELAEYINKSNIHVSHIETNQTSISMDCLLQLCVALHVTPNDILAGNYPMPSVEEITPGDSVTETASYTTDKLSTNGQKLMQELLPLIAKYTR